MLSLIFTFCVLGFTYKISFHRSDAQATNSSNKPYHSLLLKHLKFNFPLLIKFQISITSIHRATLLKPEICSAYLADERSANVHSSLGWWTLASSPSQKRALMTHHQDSLIYAGDRNRTCTVSHQNLNSVIQVHIPHFSSQIARF